MDLRHLKDRGMKKWQGLMIPELVEMLHHDREYEYYKTDKPILDEDQVTELESKIHYAMEYNYLLIFTVWEDGFTKEITGYAHYLDYIKKEIRLKDKEDLVIRLKFDDVVDVRVIES